MPSSFCFPPVEDSLGTMPTHAENSRPFRKAAPFPIAAMRAVAVTGPMPGTASNRRHDSFSRDVRSMVPSASPMKNGGDLEQIKFLLGHSSIQTTERYLGSEQDIEIAVNDNLGL
jgi:hypothetical protein